MVLRFPKKSKHIKVLLLADGKVFVQSIPDGIKVSIIDLTNDTRKNTTKLTKYAKPVNDNPIFIGVNLPLE
ncbi:MAG: hypothetical protein HN757_15095 [Calditrichaeota bacterium]|mgnify:CR=1 FL=1|nr:hypothetical protein [Calditrichota bacterium]